MTRARPYVDFYESHARNALRFFEVNGIGSAKQSAVNGKCVLLVDDDVELLKALTKILEKDGYLISAHPSANAAMRHVNESKQLFDLVITDVSMPGMKGTTFLAAVKTAFPKVPVIVITAFGDWDQYAQTLFSGAYDYLNKPLDKDALLATVRRALANGKSQVTAE